jgi:hypothetical protein
VGARFFDSFACSGSFSDNIEIRVIIEQGLKTKTDDLVIVDQQYALAYQIVLLVYTEILSQQERGFKMSDNAAWVPAGC